MSIDREKKLKELAMEMLVFAKKLHEGVGEMDFDMNNSDPHHVTILKHIGSIAVIENALKDVLNREISSSGVQGTLDTTQNIIEVLDNLKNSISNIDYDQRIILKRNILINSSSILLGEFNDIYSGGTVGNLENISKVFEQIICLFFIMGGDVKTMKSSLEKSLEFSKSNSLTPINNNA